MRSPRARLALLAFLASVSAPPVTALPVTYVVEVSPVSSRLGGCNASFTIPIFARVCPPGVFQDPLDLAGIVALPVAGRYAVSLDTAAGTASLTDLGMTTHTEGLLGPDVPLDDPASIPSVLNFRLLTGATTGDGAVFVFDPSLAPTYAGDWLARVAFRVSDTTASLEGYYAVPWPDYPVWVLSFQGTIVPEPSTLVLVALGVAGLGGARRWRPSCRRGVQPAHGAQDGGTPPFRK